MEASVAVNQQILETAELNSINEIALQHGFDLVKTPSDKWATLYAYWRTIPAVSDREAARFASEQERELQIAEGELNS